MSFVADTAYGCSAVCVPAQCSGASDGRSIVSRYAPVGSQVLCFRTAIRVRRCTTIVASADIRTYAACRLSKNDERREECCANDVDQLVPLQVTAPRSVSSRDREPNNSRGVQRGHRSTQSTTGRLFMSFRSLSRRQLTICAVDLWNSVYNMGSEFTHPRLNHSP